MRKRSGIASSDPLSGRTFAPWMSDGAPAPIEVPSRFASCRGSHPQITLMFLERPEFGRVHVFAQAELKIGRIPERNDVVLWLFPRSDENDAVSRKISSQHAKLSLHDDALVFSDNGSTNGSWLNGNRINGSVAVPLQQVSELLLADAMKLRVTPFLESTANAATDDEYLSLAPGDELWQMASRLGLGAVLIERVENIPHAECYLLLFTWAALGPGVSAESMPATLGKEQFRLVRCADQIFLDNRSGRASVKGIELVPHQAVPLYGGLELCLDQQPVRVTAVEQWGAEEMV